MSSSRLVLIFMVLSLHYGWIKCSECNDGQYTYDPQDCNAYFQCEHGRWVRRSCARDLHFNRWIIACDFPQNANCVIDSTISPTPTQPITTTPFPSTTTTSPPDPTLAPTTTPLPQTTTPNGQTTTPNGQTTTSPPITTPEPTTTPLPQTTTPNGQTTTPTPPPGQTTTQTPPPGQTTTPNGQTTTPNFQTTTPFPPTTSTTLPPTTSTSSPTTSTSTPTTSTSVPTTSTSVPTTETPIPTDPTEPDDRYRCPEVDGQYVVHLPHPNCTMFYKCVHGIPHEMLCPVDQHWANILDRCEFPEVANCIDGAAPEQPDARPPNYW